MLLFGRPIEIFLNLLSLLLAGKELLLNLRQIFIVSPLIFLFLALLLLNPGLASRAVPCSEGVDVFLGEEGEGVCALRVQPAAVRTIIFSLAGNEEAARDRPLANTEQLLVCRLLLWL